MGGRRCEECGNTFREAVSKMAGLCPECAHWLYGYPNCQHDVVVGVERRYCRKCGWDGSRSRHVTDLIQGTDADWAEIVPASGLAEAARPFRDRSDANPSVFERLQPADIRQEVGPSGQWWLFCPLPHSPSSDRSQGTWLELGATPAELEAAERRLGVTFPEDYRRFLETTNGVDEWYDDVYLSLYSVDQVVDLTEIHDHAGTLPGLVFIGSDGGGEGVGFDFRHNPPPVVLMNLVSVSWEDACFQADTFTEFMNQRERGEGLRWASGYG